MYAILVYINDLLVNGIFHIFIIFFALVWIRWLIINILSSLYKPFTTPYNARSAVLIPVMDEDPNVFNSVLINIIAQHPDQIIVVINGPRNITLENICKDLEVDFLWTQKAGKRNAIKVGMEKVKGDIVVLVDSDTLWTENTLTELLKPFSDKSVGGVTTNQKIKLDGTMLGRICSWMEDVRSNGSLRAMSVAGKVGCLPGRTIAFRAEIIRNNMEKFLTDKFLGIHKEVSDDRTLTNYALLDGWKTVYQSTSIVYTSKPSGWKKFIRQQFRWAEGSQYNNLRMSKWMLQRAKLMFFIYWTDTIIPLLVLVLLFSFGFHIIYPQRDLDLLLGGASFYFVILFSLIGAFANYCLRHVNSLHENLTHFFYVPFYIICFTLLLMPIRVVGLFNVAKNNGWGTRKEIA